MRVTFVNTFDTRGGAARAAFRLYEGVRGSSRAEACMVVQEYAESRSDVIRPGLQLPAARTSWLDQRGLKALHPDRKRVPFSVNRVPGLAPWTIQNTRPDVVHLHWFHCGFFRIEQLASLKLPLVWTIHDMWAFTGVCHYSGGCTRYMEQCGNCPLLASSRSADISRHTFLRKARTYAKLDLTIISPSRWLAGLAAASPLLADKRIEVIPNGIDVRQFAPVAKNDARALLGLPADIPLILFGADFATTDTRKGLHLLLEALHGAELGNAEVVVFGGDKPDTAPDLPVRIHWLGKILDDSRLAQVYSAANLFVAPSLDENLSNAVMEALACATPVLAFDVGGMGDMIDDGENGFLVPLREQAAGLRRVLDAVLSDSQRLAAMGRQARLSVVERFRVEEIAGRYCDVCDAVLGGR